MACTSGPREPLRSYSAAAPRLTPSTCSRCPILTRDPTWRTPWNLPWRRPIKARWTWLKPWPSVRYAERAATPGWCCPRYCAGWLTPRRIRGWMVRSWRMPSRWPSRWSTVLWPPQWKAPSSPCCVPRPPLLLRPPRSSARSCTVLWSRRSTPPGKP